MTRYYCPFVACLLGLLVMPYILGSSFVVDLIGYGHWLEPFDAALEALDVLREVRND